jgi:hypothetical protein
MSPTSALVRSFAEALKIFEHAWHDPACTAVELPVVDVNRVVSERYEAVPPRRLSRADVWDMETKKAWDPATYIPYVVSEGHSWARTSLAGGTERHLRSSVQRAWLSDTSGRVLEEVVCDPREQRIIFLGRLHLPGPDDGTLEADAFQPLFHVEHAVGGTDGSPTNRWRIVLLSDEPAFQEPFAAMARVGWLPGFLEIYIERDLGVRLRRL